jgi:hypothetical protein
MYSIANAAAGAEQSIRLNIHPLPVLPGAFAETLPNSHKPQALFVQLFSAVALTNTRDAAMQLPDAGYTFPRGLRSTIAFPGSSQALCGISTR